MNDYQPARPPAPGDADEALRALVDRQARSWECNDFDLAAADWLPDGVLVSPAGRWPADRLRDEMAAFHRDYRDLTVSIKTVFANADGSRVAVEWDWTATRRSDGERGTTPDAIIADLIDGRIKSWREYFDLSSSVEGT